MEGLETTPITPSVTPDVTPQSPAPAPTAAPAAAPAATSMQPSFDESPSDKSLMGIIKSFNWLEITFGILGATALYYTIYYYKYNMTSADKTRNEMQNRIDALEIKLADMQDEEENKNSPQNLF
jgi:hypothetical protein